MMKLRKNQRKQTIKDMEQINVEPSVFKFINEIDIENVSKIFKH